MGDGSKPGAAEPSLERLADKVAGDIREKALHDAMHVCTIWEQTKADLSKSTNPQMALVIAQVTRTTASKIKEGIFALIEKPEVVPPTRPAIHETLPSRSPRTKDE